MAWLTTVDTGGEHDGVRRNTMSFALPEELPLGTGHMGQMHKMPGGDDMDGAEHMNP